MDKLSSASTCSKSLAWCGILLLSGCGVDNADKSDVARLTASENSPAKTFSIIGTIRGLAGEKLSGDDSGAANVQVQTSVTDANQMTAVDTAVFNTDGSFVLTVGIANGAKYRVTAFSSVASRSCSVANASGVIVSDSVSVEITCATNQVPNAAALSLGFETKKLRFDWRVSNGALSYKLMRRDSGAAEFRQVGGDLLTSATSTTLAIPVHLYNWGVDGPQYRLDACNAVGCTSSNTVSAYVEPQAAELATGYIKSTDVAPGARFGTSVRLSADGKTLAIGAPYSDDEVGSVHVFRTTKAFDRSQHPFRSEKIAAPLSHSMHFGFALALSADGNTLAVGAPFSNERDKAISMSGNNLGANKQYRGAVFIYTRENGGWSATPVVVRATDSYANDNFGRALALSADGTILVVGAPGRVGSPHVKNGSELPRAGTAYVFDFRNANAASSPVVLRSSHSIDGDSFGAAVAISDRGDVIVVGAPGEEVKSAHERFEKADKALERNSGAAYRFEKLQTESQSPWASPMRFAAPKSHAYNQFGAAVAISGNGLVTVIGAPYAEIARATSTVTTAVFSGAAYVYESAPGENAALISLPSHRRNPGVFFGSTLAINSDGTFIAVGSPAILDEDQIEAVNTSGVVDVFSLSEGSTWSTQEPVVVNRDVKATTISASSTFGMAVALSGDGKSLAVGASGEDGMGANAYEKSMATDSGAVFLY